MSTASRPSKASLYVRPSLTLSESAMRSRNASATRERRAGYTTTERVLFGGRVVEVGEWPLAAWKPRGMGGRERESMAVRSDADAADMDMDLSCPTLARSRRNPGPGAVRAESEALLEQVALVEATMEGSTRVVETGEMLSDDERVAVGPAVDVMSSWRG